MEVGREGDGGDWKTRERMTKDGLSRDNPRVRVEGDYMEGLACACVFG